MNTVQESRLIEQLVAVSRTIAETDEPARLLFYVTDAALKLVGAEWGYIGLIDEDGGVDVQIAHTPAGQDYNLIIDATRRSILDEVAGTKQVVMINDVQPKVGNGRLNGSSRFHSRSVMCLPLMARGKFLGTFYVEKASFYSPFRQNDLHSLSILAEQTAVSLHAMQLSAALSRNHAHQELSEEEINKFSQVQDALRESETTYATLVENAHDGVIILQDYRFKYANQAALGIVGYTSDELESLQFDAPIAPESREMIRLRYEQRISGAKVPDQYEAVLLHKNGARKNVDISAALIQYQGKPAVMAIIRDITERKLSEQALTRSQERLQLFMDGATESFTIWDADMRLVDLNQTTLQYLPPGTQKEDVIGMHFLNFFPDSLRQGRFQEYENVIKTGKPIYKDGLIVPSVIGNRFLNLCAFKVSDGLGLITNDVTERRQVETQLHTLTRAVEQSRMLVMITDACGRIEYVNSRFTGVSGYKPEEVIGKNPRLLNSGEMPPELFVRLWQAISSGNEWHGELLNQKKSGELFWELGSISPVKNPQGKITHFLAIMEDITERKALEEQVRRQDRLAAVGHLAAGIAHDFNNILAVISLYSDMMLRSSELPQAAGKYSQSILQQSRRAGDLIQQILDFSRQSTLKRSPIELSAMLDQLVKLLQRTLPENIELSLTYDPGFYQVHADLTRMQQVFMNLAVNARDAMPAGGQLKIKLEKPEKDDCTQILDLEDAVSHWIRVQVSDNGVGMTKDVLAHLFEPFFTTKEPGKGTGLGLAQVYGIVKQHDGHIDVQSQPNEGAVFSILLPALAAEETNHVGQVDVTISLGQGETILVVEDNAATREAIVQSLMHLNYKAVVAEHGVAALAALEAEGDGIDLILSDVVMPVMGGEALLDALQAKEIWLPVVMMTGHMLDITPADLHQRMVNNFLLKPLSLADLSHALSNALGGK